MSRTTAFKRLRGNTFTPPSTLLSNVEQTCTHLDRLWNSTMRHMWWEILSRPNSNNSELVCLTCNTSTCTKKSTHSLHCDQSVAEIFCSTCDKYVFSLETDRVRCHALYDKKRRGEGGQGVKAPFPCSIFSLRGLVNMGNTCFMNSVLQVVINIPMLRDFFLSGRHNRLCPIQKAMRTLCDAASSPLLQPTTTTTTTTPGQRYATLWNRSWATAIPSLSSSPLPPPPSKTPIPPPQPPSPTRPISLPPQSQLDTVCFGCEIETLIAEMCCPRDPTSNAPLKPNDFLVSLWKETPRLAGYLQQDSQEFFSALVNALHAHTCTNDDVRVDAAAPLATPSQANREGRLQCTCSVHSTLAGVLQSQINCSSCKISRNLYEAFFDIPLQIPTGMVETTLVDCITAFTKKEIFAKEDNGPCDSCNKQTERTKCYTVHTLPHMLTFHLKRFHSVGPLGTATKKSDAIVNFPFSLDMRPFASSNLCMCYRARGFFGLKRGLSALSPAEYPAGATTTTTASAIDGTTPGSPPFTPLPNCTCYLYDLFAMVQHFGELGSGHYISFVKHCNSWFCFNDGRISGVDEAQVRDGQAYMLFYQKRPVI